MQGRVAGFILIGSGIAVGIVGLAILGLFAGAAGLSAAGFGVGVILLLIVVLPLIGAGVFLLMKSSQEGKEEEIIAKQRKILDAVQARGQVRISDLVLELKSSKEQVQNWVYNLVGMGLFSGYIDWQDGVLYSVQASQLKDLTECKKCGGKVELAGKGVSKCQYCGTEYFL
jgi:membrane protein implicated in regulation of membrane protease activity